jgi:phosphopantothenoylcysteine decarboxylase/phosphopantothenate--cysteine ligase
MKKSVLIGVCGGIAAYKILELIPRLRKRGIDVSVIMTGSATKMIDPHAFEKASGNHTYHQLFRRPINHKTILATRRVEHIDVAKKADLFLIAPATANTIAKLATGIADDYLTTVALALTCPVVICPAMNARLPAETLGEGGWPQSKSLKRRLSVLFIHRNHLPVNA